MTPLMMAKLLKSNIKIKEQMLKEAEETKKLMIEELIRTNIKKITEQKKKNKEIEVIKDQQRRIRFLEMEKYNDKIRKMNQRSTRKRKKRESINQNQIFKAPKKKNRTLEFEAFKTAQMNHQKSLTKTQRRREIGLDFLNSLETDRIKMIVQKNQDKLKKNLSLDSLHQIQSIDLQSKKSMSNLKIKKEKKKRVKSPPPTIGIVIDKKKLRRKDLLKKLAKINEKIKREALTKEAGARNKSRITFQKKLNVEVVSPANRDLEERFSETELAYLNSNLQELYSEYRSVIAPKKAEPKTGKKENRESKRKRKAKKKKNALINKLRQTYSKLEKEVPQQDQQTQSYGQLKTDVKFRSDGFELDKDRKLTLSQVDEQHLEKSPLFEVEGEFSASSEEQNEGTFRVNTTEKTDFNPEEHFTHVIFDEAAILIQKYVRGWIVRRGIEAYKEYLREQEDEALEELQGDYHFSDGDDDFLDSSNRSLRRHSEHNKIHNIEVNTIEFSDDKEQSVIIDKSNSKMSKYEKKDEGIQTSFKNEVHTEPKLTLSERLRIEKLDLEKAKLGKDELEVLAKQEYVKWSQMRNMIQFIEDRLGSRAAQEVKSLFKQMEEYADKSKKSLKETFLNNETCLSNQLSEIRARLTDEQIQRSGSLRVEAGKELSKRAKEKVTVQPLPYLDDRELNSLSREAFKSEDKVPKIDFLDLNDVRRDGTTGGSKKTPSIDQKRGYPSRTESNVSEKNKIKFLRKDEMEKWVDGASRNSLTLSPTSSCHIKRSKSKYDTKITLRDALGFNFLRKSKKSSEEICSERRRDSKDRSRRSGNNSSSQIEAPLIVEGNNSFDKAHQSVSGNISSSLGPGNNIKVLNNFEPESKSGRKSEKSIGDKLDEIDARSMEDITEGAECHYDQDLNSFSKPDDERELGELDIVSSDIQARKQKNKTNPSITKSEGVSSSLIGEARLESDSAHPLSQLVEGEQENKMKLKSFVENSKVDMDWLISELIDHGEADEVLEPKPHQTDDDDLEFNEEMKTCRIEFLTDAVTDLIVGDLIDELQTEPFWSKRFGDEAAFLYRDGDDSDAETIYGIRTNYNAVNEYCNLLVKFIYDNFAGIVLERINREKTVFPLEELRILRERDELEEDEDAKNHWDIFEEDVLAKGIDVEVPHPEIELVLPIKIFEVLEDEILSNYQHMNILPELFEMQRIYHRAIFDCLNEALSYPMIINEDGYIKRVLYERKTLIRVLSTEDVLEKLHYCKDIVLEWSSLLCGIIRDKEDSMIGNIKFMEPEVINQLREERLFRFLSIEALEKENTWINYEREEVRALVDCSDHIFEEIMEELIEDLIGIKGSRKMLK